MPTSWRASGPSIRFVMHCFLLEGSRWLSAGRPGSSEPRTLLISASTMDVTFGSGTNKPLPPGVRRGYNALAFNFEQAQLAGMAYIACRHKVRWNRMGP